MNKWFYRQDDQPVGPFDWTVLNQLKVAGIIDDRTPVKTASDTQWRAFGESTAEGLAGQTTSSLPPDEETARFYYLDAGRRPVGPFRREALRRLYDERVISASTMVSGQGEDQWHPASNFLGLRDNPPKVGSVGGWSPGEVAAPQRRTFEQFTLLMAVTLTLYVFYWIPATSRDMKAITRRPRMEFMPLLILGIVTFGLLIVIMMILWAYDLEIYGRAHGTSGRQESLGTYVLVLNVLGLIMAFFSGGLALILSGVLSAGAAWMLQKEINLYGPPAAA